MWKKSSFFGQVYLLLLINKECASHTLRETENENKQFKNIISNSYLIRKAFKGTVVNRALPSLHEGSLEITRTVPLIIIISEQFL